MLGMPVAQLRAWVRAGFLEPARGTRGEFLFSFQDLVLLRTASNLVRAKIKPRRVRAALYKLKAQMPEDRPLSGIHIATEGTELVVHDREGPWNPESGQRLFSFSLEASNDNGPNVEVLPTQKPLQLVRVETLESLQEKHAEDSIPSQPIEAPELPSAEEEDEAKVEAEMSADDWFDLGYELETCAPRQARDAYRRALELNPDNPEIHLNLGRLLFEASELSASERHYRLAAEGMTEQAEPAFNLGVVLEEMGQLEGAIMAFRESIRREPQFSDGYARLLTALEASGDMEQAAEIRAQYRKLGEQ